MNILNSNSNPAENSEMTDNETEETIDFTILNAIQRAALHKWSDEFKSPDHFRFTSVPPSTHLPSDSHNEIVTL